jgi:hypothetical protein
MRKTTFLVLLALAPCCAGCLGKQFARDGISLRQAILDMYTDQIMDNLIRARCNMPFVQLKYSQIQANDSDEYSATGAIDQTIETARDLITGAVMRTLTNDYKAAATGDRKMAMNFTADPITDENDIYQKYMAFAMDPSLLVVSDCPPQGPVHILRKRHGCYYWVPCEAGPAFLDLCMKTTFMRGKDDGAIVPAAYAVKITGLENTRKSTEDTVTAMLVFDKEVPNGEGLLVVDLPDGRAARIGVLRVYQDPDGKRVDVGQPTRRLLAQWFPERDKVQPEDLKDRSARFYSHDYPPEVPAPSPVLRQINTNLNTIRAEVQLQRGR